MTWNVNNCYGVLAVLAISICQVNIATAVEQAADDDVAVGAQAAPDLAGFRSHVAPFFAQHCVKCHGPEKQKADLALHGIDGNVVTGADVETWAHVVERLIAGEMPPKDEPRPNAHARDRVIAWITAELAKAGREVRKPEGFDLPSRGNLLEHNLLFAGEVRATLDAPPRFWRISPFIYDQLVNDLAKGITVAQPFAVPPDPGFKDYAAGFGIDEPTAAQLIRNAHAIAERQSSFKIEDGKLKGQFGASKEFVTLLDPQIEPTDELIEKAIRRQFELVVKRVPSDEELARFSVLMRQNIAQAGRTTGVRTTLASVLLMPEVVFRFELGQGPVEAQGRRMLAPRELAYAIAFALTDRRPDFALLRAADEGKLATREDVAAQVQRLFDDPKTNKPRIVRFFQEYFGYTAAPDVFKDKEAFKHHRAEILVADTDALILHILEKDQNVLAQLLTTNKSFVNYRNDRKKGVIKAHDKDHAELSYNIEPEQWSAEQPMTLPADQRAGILTQPSWLVAHSLNTENHAILRGKWVRERLLGGSIPDLPITVDAQLPEDPDKTLRQRMAVTTQEYCWNCHQKMNPLGLAFENFDHFGRFRTTELDKPVDASGSIDDSGGGSADDRLEGPVTDSLDMIHKLARSEHVRQVFVRHAFRYWMGRNETPGDAGTLRDADRAYVASGGSMNALITALLTSDSFLYRVAGPDPALNRASGVGPKEKPGGPGGKIAVPD